MISFTEILTEPEFSRRRQLARLHAVVSSTAPDFVLTVEIAPSSRIDTEFVDACVLETHRGETDFFEGKLFDFIRDDLLRVTIQDVTVHMACSRAVVALHDARKKYTSAASWNRPSNVPCRATELAEGALKQQWTF
ncbi:hypothetical protein ACFXKI_45415 [Streptomyces mirabilis]|uniref:hypothetical protein n=1 Tax=Streptomyces mirabilis TaxID=68239 RepID=UPI0036BD797F